MVVDEAGERRDRVFLLSPANCAGARGRLLLSDRASFPLALALRQEGARLGDIFSFVSGLYFRGKLAYARRFAAPPDPTDALVGSGVLVITPSAGLRAADTLVTVEALRSFVGVEVAPDNPSYRNPLVSSATVLHRAIGNACDVILLGSIASSRYLDLLTTIFGEQLQFPADFVGRGDMSRGALMLRQAVEGQELRYVKALGAIRSTSRR